MKKSKLWAASVLTLAIALSACGNQEASPSPSTTESETASSELVITAVNYNFDQREYRVKAGESVKIVLKSSGNHGLEIKDLGLELDKKHSSQVITPKAGTYDFECTIMCGAGHKGMTAKLIVE